MDRRKTYTETATRGVLDDLRSVGTGGRNNALYKAAARFGELVGAGLLEDGWARAELAAAASDIGLNGREAQSVIRSGMTGGKAQGWKPPLFDGPSESHRRPHSPARSERGATMGRPSAESEPDRRRPDAGELAQVWKSALKVDAPAAADDLARLMDARSSSYDLAQLAALDLVRVLPSGARCPNWAWVPEAYRDGDGRHWGASDYRLLVLMYEASGERAGEPGSVRARYLGRGKDLTPMGCTAGVLWMANDHGQALLRGDADGLAGLLVCEGVPDFLRAALELDGHRFAVLGGVSGSFQHLPELPPGLAVYIAVDGDTGGIEYAGKLCAALAPSRGDGDGLRGVYRVLLPEGQDLDDALAAEPGALTTDGGLLWLAREDDPMDAPDTASTPPLVEADPFADRWLTVAELSTAAGQDWLSYKPPGRKYLLSAPPDPESSSKTWAGFLPLGKTGMLAAAGGAGKTWALVQLAVAVAAGVPNAGMLDNSPRWLGTYRVDSPGRVLLALGEEDGEELRRRLFHAANVMGLSDDDRQRAARQIVALPLTGRAVALTEAHPTRGAVRSPVATMLRDRLVAGAPWSLVILDPFSRWAGADAETDNAAATRAVEVLEWLTEVKGNPTVLIAHHTTKSSRTGATDATAARGSSALSDGLRWQANLDPVVVDGARQSGAVHLKTTKSNYGVHGAGLMLIRDSDHAGALRPATKTERAEAEEDQKQARLAAAREKGRRKAEEKAAEDKGKADINGGAQSAQPKARNDAPGRGDM